MREGDAPGHPPLLPQKAVLAYHRAMNSSVTDSQLQSSLDSMILSASGWRKVFAPGGDEAADTQPSPADRLLAVGMGVAWGEWLTGHLNKTDPAVLAATDTRPTGPALAEALICGLESCGCRVRWAGVAAAPEAMARAGHDPDIDAFAYISASHNPVGHNGVKFGLGGGGHRRQGRRLAHRLLSAAHRGSRCGRPPCGYRIGGGTQCGGPVRRSGRKAPLSGGI
jgi:hypothetical protein